MDTQVLAALQGLVTQLQGIATSAQTQIDADKADAAAAQAKVDADNADIATRTTGLTTLSAIIQAEQDLITKYTPAAAPV